jgi:hypothetical protein
LLDKSGFLINSHDLLRSHVLKHIRQNSLICLCYSVAEMGIENQKRFCVRARRALTVFFVWILVCAARTPGLRFCFLVFKSHVRRREKSQLGGGVGEDCLSK